jgi:murein DD-endopeptidase MepM/ murein hydrolase activator NlpD
MEDVYTRLRYSRYGGRVRRRKKAGNGRFAAKVARQVLICAIILGAIWGIKGIESPVASYVVKGAKWVVEKSVEPKMLYESIKGLFERRGTGGNLAIKSGDNQQTDEEGDNEQAAGNADIRNTEEIHAGNVLSASVGYGDNPVFEFPLDGHIAVPFGQRDHYLRKIPEFHCGVDIAVKDRAEVRAAMDGCVTETGEKDHYGMYLKIDHGGGWQTIYGHCSQVLVTQGDSVGQGVIVAEVGTDAGLAESHLHFEIWKDGMPVDPLLYLKKVPS